MFHLRTPTTKHHSSAYKMSPFSAIDYCIPLPWNPYVLAASRIDERKRQQNKNPVYHFYNVQFERKENSKKAKQPVVLGKIRTDYSITLFQYKYAVKRVLKYVSVQKSCRSVLMFHLRTPTTKHHSSANKMSPFRRLTTVFLCHEIRTWWSAELLKNVYIWLMEY